MTGIVQPEDLDPEQLGPHEMVIFPRQRRVETEFQRMRRPRAEFRASERRARSLYGSRSGSVTARAVGPHSVEFTGATGAVIEAARSLQRKWMPSPDRSGVLVPAGDAEDVTAYLEAQLGKRIEVTM